MVAIQPLRPESRRDMRALAFHFIYAMDRSDYAISIEEIIQNFRSGFNVEIDDDSLAVTMAHGAIEQREELDEFVKPLLRNWKLERLGCCTRLILRLALWELQQPNAIASIVINEAIELAKAFAEKDAYKFINGILDEAAKLIKPSEGNHDQPSPPNES
ncbi:transcription antitermination factor NusB [Candidatus Babeliales bacterium]|nr:transcription antitermination factor NusB [Candidatus Babeliales bacterium]